ADERDLAPPDGTAARDVECLPGPLAHQTDEPGLRADRAARNRNLAEHLEPDREVEWREHPDVVDLPWPLPAETGRAQADDLPELLTARQLPEQLDAGVVAPLVHHEPPPVRRRCQTLGGRRVVRQRLCGDD